MSSDSNRPGLLVTGGTGFMGRAFVQHLVANGRYDVVVATRRQEAEVGAGARPIFVGPIDEATDWSGALAGCDLVVHLAGWAHDTRASTEDVAACIERINVEGTRKLAEAAAEAGVRRFVYLSSIKVLGDSGVFTEDASPAPEDIYGRTKLQAEKILAEIGTRGAMEVVVIRPPLVYGPGVKANYRALIGLVASSWPLPLGALENRRSMVGLRNLTDFIVRCVEHPKAAGETFLVSDGEDLSTPALIRMIARALGKSPRLVSAPTWFLRKLATVVGRQREFARLQGSLQVVPRRAVDILGWRPPHTVNDEVARTVAQWRIEEDFGWNRSPAKRAMDLALLVLMLPFVLPLCLAIALCVKGGSAGPILYWSNRVGRDNRIFRMPKFRSMKVGTPAVATHLLQSPLVHITAVGGFLRRTSLDELPQLWNILLGEMSFVGPRPALFNQYDLVRLRTAAGVHRLTPGLTGWAQVNGRDELSIEKKLEFDACYMQSKSFSMDLRILRLTVIAVWRRTGVSH